MEKKDFTITIELAKPCDVVFKALTQDVAKWWGGQDLMGSMAKLDDEFIILHPGAHYSKQRVVEIIPCKRIVWLVTESELSWLKNKDEWTNTKMVFESDAADNNTRLTFTHEGLVPGKECYERCANEGWNTVIKDYLYRFVNENKAHF